ncbi:MAG: 50S ribosomal protein L4 [Gemmatimonadetes bacterium]|nr:50S ribosomal protein L4 [Gemmatimonadota bacterium]
MFSAPYFKADGTRDGSRELPIELFDGACNEFAVHAAVKTHLNNLRRGTGSAKNRSAVAGGSRKPWRQKGTGRARQGTTRAAQWRGGGVAFPPIPHSWRQRLPKRIRSLARRSALNDRAEHGRVFVGELPSLEAPRTRALVSYLGMIETWGKVLVLTDSVNRSVYLSCRNLPGVLVRPFGHESVYDLVWAGTVFIEADALDLSTAAADSKTSDSETSDPPVAEVNDA